MQLRRSDFRIATVMEQELADSDITEVLAKVYVDGGFTTHEEAVSLFEPSAVKARGTIIAAWDNQRAKLAGMIIVVPPNSPAMRLAKGDEAELHLLGVRPEYRRHGLGRQLIDSAIEYAKQRDYSKLILWTQISMNAAQRLYESADFVHIRDFEGNGRIFKLYERLL